MSQKVVILEHVEQRVHRVQRGDRFFNFKNSSQREPSKKNLDHILIVMRDYAD